MPAEYGSEETRVPSHRASWNAIWLLDDVRAETLKSTAEAAAANTAAAAGSPERIVGGFFRSAMDEARIEEAGAGPLTQEFERIAAIRDIGSLQDEIARLHKIGVAVAFTLDVRQDLDDSTRQIPWLLEGGLGMSGPDDYVGNDERSRKKRDEYTAHVRRMFELLGDAQAAAEALSVMNIETRLAENSQNSDQLRDQLATRHPMTVPRAAQGRRRHRLAALSVRCWARRCRPRQRRAADVLHRVGSGYRKATNRRLACLSAVAPRSRRGESIEQGIRIGDVSFLRNRAQRSDRHARALVEDP